MPSCSLQPLRDTPPTREHLGRQVMTVACCAQTTYSYTPSEARAARVLCCDDVRAERAPIFVLFYAQVFTNAAAARRRAAALCFPILDTGSWTNPGT